MMASRNQRRGVRQDPPQVLRLIFLRIPSRSWSFHPTAKGETRQLAERLPAERLQPVELAEHLQVAERL